jgi:hypothetical protein
VFGASLGAIDSIGFDLDVQGTSEGEGFLLAIVIVLLFVIGIGRLYRALGRRGFGMR